MKRILALFVISSVMLFVSGICLAESVEKAIVIEHKNEKEILDRYAIVDEAEILIPVDVVKDHLQPDVTLHEAQQQLTAKFLLPKFRLADAALNKNFLKRAEIVLPYKTINGTAYINAAVAAKVFGFAIKNSDDDLTIQSSQYNSFSPQHLPKKKKNEIDGKVIMAWQPILEDDVDVTKMEKINGLNVASPSWFAIVEEDGTIKNKVDYRYVKAAQARGYQVWPLITNSFNPDLTHAVLSDENARQNVIKQLVIYAALYEFDGINIDFENVYDRDRELLNLFVKEIADNLKKLDLTISIDVTIPSEVSQWSMCYDRKTLADSVDFVMLMAYDEHWRTSPVSGSVASIGWVEKGLMRTLEEVPAHKLVLGIPFYMREWQEDAAGNVKAKTMTMSQAENVIEEKGLVPLWLDDIGQYYFEYQKENDDKRYRVWQEEARSITLKTELVGKYELAGVAAWRKGFEKPEIWNVISEKLQPPVASDEHHKDKKKKKKRKDK